MKNSVRCSLHGAKDYETDDLSLSSFVGQRIVLVTPLSEIVGIVSDGLCARMVIRNSTLLIGESVITFEIRSLENTSNAIDTIDNLRRLRSIDFSSTIAKSTCRSKYCDYLLALDGHLAGRSYRDIAEILYGSDRVGPYWTDDSRGYKSKMRRAVERGLALMNGGYRELL